MDVVVLYTEPAGGAGAQIMASGQESVLGLAGNWNTAEFNVFGYGAGSAAIFNADNSGATIAVQVSINDGTANAPTCIWAGSGRFTTESNSLTLMPEVPDKTGVVDPALATCLPFYGENAGGTALPSIEFLESNGPYNGISVTAEPASSVTGSSAVLNGSVNPHGSEALAWFEYSTNSTPSCNSPQSNSPQTTYSPPTQAVNIGSGGEDVLFSAPISGLIPGTTYYFWACAVGALYQANSNVLSFVTVSAPPTAILSADPTAISSGQSSTLSWTVTNATTASIDQGIGAVSATGSETVSPSTTTTYTLTAANAAGSVTATATVTVTAPLVPPVITAFSASPASLSSPGQSATLNWSVNNATSAAISPGIGNVNASSGSVAVMPAATTTYVLTATNGAGSVTQSATVNVGSPLTVALSTAGQVEPFAAQSIVSAYGTNLATSTASASSLPLPTSLDGTSVIVTDSAGVARDAPLFYISPLQINFEVPASTATGMASVNIQNQNGNTQTATIQIGSVSPGLFELNGSGLVAAWVLPVISGIQQPLQPVYQIVSEAVVPLPITVGLPAEQIYLEMYGTGIRNANSVTATIGGVSVPVLFAGPAPGFAGEDQVNIGPLPQSLAGMGNVNIVLTAGGQPANTVNLTIQ
jgi:uncharacterized protein (TIGR03437 family)